MSLFSPNNEKSYIITRKTEFDIALPHLTATIWTLQNELFSFATVLLHKDTNYLAIL